MAFDLNLMTAAARARVNLLVATMAAEAVSSLLPGSKAQWEAESYVDYCEHVWDETTGDLWAVENAEALDAWYKKVEAEEAFRLGFVGPRQRGGYSGLQALS